VPFFTYWLAFVCTEQSCGISNLGEFHSKGLSAMSNGSWWSSLVSWEGMAVYGAWYLWTVACWAFIPAEVVEGGALRDGTKLKYKMNGELLSAPRLHALLIRRMDSLLYARAICARRCGHHVHAGTGTDVVCL
jgi:hypothetical protein